MEFRINGKPVKTGTKIKDFRRETWTFLRVSREPSPGKTGRVTVRQGTKFENEFFPGVFDGEIVDVCDVCIGPRGVSVALVDDSCPSCHVYHGDPCADCGMRGYHAALCDGDPSRPEVDDSRVHPEHGGGATDGSNPPVHYREDE